MNHYFASDGTRYSKAEIDRKVSAAKKQKLQQQIDEIGYTRCEVCKRNDCIPVDCSHLKSVNFCQKNRCVELAWNTTNILPTGRKCHQKYDGLDLRFS